MWIKIVLVIILIKEPVAQSQEFGTRDSKNLNPLFSSENYTSRNSKLIKATDLFLRSILKSHFTSVYLITAVSDEKHICYTDFVSQFIAVTSKNYAVRFENVMKLSRTYKKLRQNSVFLIDGIENFRLLSSTIVSERYKFSGHFLFLLLFGHFKELEEIFATMSRKEIHSVYALYETTTNINLCTHLPYHDPLTCGSTKPHVIAKFRDGKFIEQYSTQHFPREFKNLHTCPVRVVTYHDPGFIHVNTFKNGSYVLHGRGITFLDTLAEALNFTPEISVGKGEMPYGMIYDNGTITGNFRKLYENLADVSFSEFYLKSSRNKYFDNSMTLYTTPMVFIIPPGKPYGRFEKLLKPFHSYVWVVLFIAVSFAVTVILLINMKAIHLKNFVFGKRIKSPFSNLLLVLFGFTMTKLPGRNFARFLLMMFLILCLVLRSIYQGSLFQFLQSDERHKEIQSIDEMIKKDFTFYLRESVLDLITNESSIYKRTEKWKSDIRFYDGQLTGDETIAGLESLSNIQAENLNGSDIKYCKENLVTYSVVLYFRRNFFLREEINNKIESLVSSGIIDHWIRNSSKYHGVMKTNNAGPRKLTLKDLSGPFIILIFGYLAAFIVLMLEILDVRYGCLLTVKKIFLREKSRAIPLALYTTD